MSVFLALLAACSLKDRLFCDYNIWLGNAVQSGYQTKHQCLSVLSDLLFSSTSGAPGCFVCADSSQNREDLSHVYKGG